LVKGTKQALHDEFYEIFRDLKSPSLEAMRERVGALSDALKKDKASGASYEAIQTLSLIRSDS
jgi:hypothetical protein